MRHGTYDAYWKARNLRPHLKDVKPAVMTVGGWFDAENLFGALECYKQIESSSPNTQNILVMGPWYHGQWGGRRDPGDHLGLVRFDAKTADYYRESVELPFFEHHLKGAPDPKLPEALVFQTGSNRWRRLDAWPPKTAKGKTALVWCPTASSAFDLARPTSATTSSTNTSATRASRSPSPPRTRPSG